MPAKYEPSFTACDNVELMGDAFEGEFRFSVIDAECETICHCPDMERAEMVAAALNASPQIVEQYEQ